MTIAERIKRVAKKANIPYSAVKHIIYSRYGNCEKNEIDILLTLEKEYGI